MAKRPPVFRPAGWSGGAQAYERRRRDAYAWRAWYKTKRWRAIRADQLQREPLCRICTGLGLTVAANVCDHVDPHRGDPIKFWAGPFQSLCDPCHSSAKQRAERGGGAGQNPGAPPFGTGGQ